MKTIATQPGRENDLHSIVIICDNLWLGVEDGLLEDKPSDEPQRMLPAGPPESPPTGQPWCGSGDTTSERSASRARSCVHRCPVARTNSPREHAFRNPFPPLVNHTVARSPLLEETIAVHAGTESHKLVATSFRHFANRERMK